MAFGVARERQGAWLPVLSAVNSARLQLRRATPGGLSGRLAAACQGNPICTVGSTPAAHRAPASDPHCGHTVSLSAAKQAIDAPLRLMTAAIQRWIAEPVRPGNARLGCALLLDIDGFKQVNDTRGHLAGDMLLRGFAGRLSKVLRANDSIARPGGDEFAIVVEGLRQADDAETIAQNIVSAMRLSRFASMTPSKEFAGC